MDQPRQESTSLTMWRGKHRENTVEHRKNDDALHMKEHAVDEREKGETPEAISSEHKCDTV